MTDARSPAKAGPHAEDLLEPLLELHARVRDRVVAATEQQHVETLSAIDRDEPGDTIYAIDVVSEQVIAEFAETLGREHSFVLVSEGNPRPGTPKGVPYDGGVHGTPKGVPYDGGVHGTPEGVPYGSNADWVVIVDPIDGTRGLMYQKRSAWVLTGVAPNRGSETSLRDVVLAVQTEIPLVKQHLSDQLWALRGEGAQMRRFNRLTGKSTPIRLQPSTAVSIEHGYASMTRFFPGARDELAAIDEAVVFSALGPYASGKAHCFEDQYASTGGQLYELVAGHDRFIADLRPLMRPVLAARGLPQALTCHPYDICTALIADECGVIVTDADGRALDVPLNVEAEVAWVGYANAAIRAQIEPQLQKVLRERGLILGRPEGRPLPTKTVGADLQAGPTQNDRND